MLVAARASRKAAPCFCAAQARGIASARRRLDPTGDQHLGHEPIQLRLVPPFVGSLDQLQSFM